MGMKRWTPVSVFVQVTAGALAGMVMGGLFGWAAASLAPTLFAKLIPWEDLEPVGTAVVIGAAGGVFCGAALAAFGLVVSALMNRVSRG